MFCRQRQDDDKWEHDLYKDDDPQVSSMFGGVEFSYSIVADALVSRNILNDTIVILVLLITLLYGSDIMLMVLIDRRIGTKDLRFKLQKKSILQAIHSRSGSVSGIRDLREKLSGSTYSQPVKSDLPKPKPTANRNPKPLLEGSRKSVIIEAPESETKKVASSVHRKKTQRKVWTVHLLLYFFPCLLRLLQRIKFIG